MTAQQLEMLGWIPRRTEDVYASTSMEVYVPETDTVLGLQVGEAFPDGATHWRWKPTSIGQMACGLMLEDEEE